MRSAVVDGSELSLTEVVTAGDTIVDAPADGDTVAARAERKSEIAGAVISGPVSEFSSALGATQLSFGHVSPLMQPYT